MKKTNKITALVLAFVMLLTTTIGGTLAYMVTGTDAVKNTFVSGLDPEGDLCITKTVQHPFGAGYTIPAELAFDFTVSLGADYAGKTVATSQGEKTADENGDITVSIAPGGRLIIDEIAKDTSVTVTEAAKPGFAVSDGVNPKTGTISIYGTTIDFVNIYTPEKADPSFITVNGKKVLDGRDWQLGDIFTFSLEYKAPGAAEWQQIATAVTEYAQIEVQDPEFPDDPEKTILVDKPDYDKFSFTDAVQAVEYSAPGTYCFRVSEITGTAGGVDYSGIISYIDVVVGDADMNGYLEIQDVTSNYNAVTTKDENGVYNVNVTVTNTYAPAGSATVKINIDKTVNSLSGKDKTAEGFTFELYDEAGNLVEQSQATTAAGETEISLTYNAADAGRIFNYTLKETNAGQTIAPFKYDATEHKLSVAVIDNGDGTVSAVIYNTPRPPASVQEDESAQQPESNVQETPAESNTEQQTEYAEGEAEQQSEEAENIPAQPEENESNAENQPEQQATDEQPVQPQTEEQSEQPAGEIVPQAEDTPDDVPRVSPSVSVDTIPETMQGGQSEIALVGMNLVLEPQPEGNEEPQPEEQQIIPVEEPPVAANTPPANATDEIEVAFTNIYDPADESLIITGKKKLENKTLKENMFTFRLYVTAENFDTNGINPEQTTSHDNKGDFSFDEITLDKVGTSWYVVKEITSNMPKGVTPDTNEYHITVNVADDNGVLKKDVKITDKRGNETEILFVNKYRPLKTQFAITGKKVIKDSATAEIVPIGSNRFTFSLYDADSRFNITGNVKDTAVNDENGVFTFDAEEYTAAGDYFYVVKENSENLPENIAHDDTVYGVKVIVTDDEGQLEAAVQITEIGKGTAEEVVFENIYTAPVVEPDPTPQPPEPPQKPGDSSADTGDNTPDMTFWLIMMILSSTATVVLILLERKEDEETAA